MSRTAACWLLQVLLSLLVVTIVSMPVGGQAGAAGGEWRYYGGDPGNSRYSPLDQITRENVKDLKVAWRWKAANFGPQPDFNYQATPLMVGGSSLHDRRHTARCGGD